MYSETVVTIPAMPTTTVRVAKCRQKTLFEVQPGMRLAHRRGKEGKTPGEVQLALACSASASVPGRGGRGGGGGGVVKFV